MYYTKRVDDIADKGVRPDPALPSTDHPAAYRSDDNLVAAVNVALTLERPLLLTGDPGTGKTQLAYSLAWQLASRKLLGVTSARVERFETKSTSVSRDLFYSFDVLGRFQASHTGGSMNNLDYLSYNALGRAVIEGQPRERVASYLPATYDHQGPRRCVALIDEIDKAPRDFPNDLLNEIDQMYFRVPELKNAQLGAEGEGLKPIVVITSNSEKSLPDPFLRRCIYYDIPPARDKALDEILLARLAKFDVPSQLLTDARRFYETLKGGVVRRKISVAELLQWLTYMLRAKPGADATLKSMREQAFAGLAALTKTSDEQGAVRSELESFLKSS